MQVHRICIVVLTTLIAFDFYSFPAFSSLSGNPGNVPETVDVHVPWTDEDLDLGLDSGGLVCVLVHVEEDILLDHGRHLPPLLCGGVHGFGEVEADMQRFNPMQNVVKVSENSPAN